MKILCDKCGNEFIIKKNIIKNQSFTMRCPICKNQIDAKVMEPHNYTGTKHEDSIVLPDRHHANSAEHAETGSPYDKPYGKHQSEKGDFEIQRDMIRQIENGLDNIVETVGEFVDDTGVISRIDSQKSGIMEHWYVKFLDSINIPRITVRYISYVYYTMAICIVFTALFLFADLIKLNGMTQEISSIFMQMVHNATHYI
jgi:DNA-directed RNA polymerase subunit M/transcription elongation factor TFIIS